MFLFTPLPLTSPPPLPVTDGAVSMFVNLAYERWGFLRCLWPQSGWELVPSVTGGACYFENGCLTSCLHGQVHFDVCKSLKWTNKIKDPPYIGGKHTKKILLNLEWLFEPIFAVYNFYGRFGSLSIIFFVLLFYKTCCKQKRWNQVLFKMIQFRF